MATVLATVAYGLALWFGLYLINRDWRSAPLLWAGAGLVSYALALALTAWTELAGQSRSIAGLTPFLLYTPALCWAGALLAMLPENEARAPLKRIAVYGVMPASFVLLVGNAINQNQGLVVVVGMFVLGMLLVALVAFARAMRARRVENFLGLMLVAALFFGLSLVLAILPTAWFPRTWLLVAMGGDLLLFGVAVVRFDAFQQGEALLPDVLRSLDTALLAALVLGGQVALVIWFATGLTPAMLVLLFGVIGAGITMAVFADSIQRTVDKIVFARFPQVRQAREDLRTVAQVLPRIAPSHDLLSLDEEEFARLTRRAISNFGNLPRLATSPLTQIPIIDQRLAARGAPDDTLERAIELKTLLAESIGRLKPNGQVPFGNSDEWRYYNALYFPYVLGLKPYSRRASVPDDPTAQAALTWFQQDIPERTLYNWQNTAARMVARDLREKFNESTV